MLSIESSAKTVKQAIEDGLKKLNKSIDEVEVKIISQPGIFRKAKVLISVEGAESMPEVKKEQPVETKHKQQEPVRHENKKAEGNESRQPEALKIKTEEKKNHDNSNSFSAKKQNRPQQKRGGENKDSLKDAQKDKRQGKDDFFNKNRNNDKRNERKPDEKKESASDYKQREYREITDEAAEIAGNFVDGLLSRMGIEYSMIRKRENGALQLEIASESGATIGYRGETLDSIEYLASLTVNKNSDKYYKINVDCNGYRIKREEMLAAMAARLADKAVRTQRKVIMEPMNNFSRKVIHSALSDNDKIFTRSEGTEPYRHIVIIPKRK